MKAQLGALSLDLSTGFTAPWTVLFGPSGSGKSSLLRAMAGILPLGRSESRFSWAVRKSDSSIQFERRGPAGAWIALQGTTPEARNLAYAPQTASLFPHLTAGENVCFSQPRSSSLQASALVEEARDLFEVSTLWNRRPTLLSGGEQQRVNLARAFVRPGAELMLLDEPFTGIGRAFRNRLLPRLGAALTSRSLPVISVTHDVEEAFLLQADAIRIEEGRLVVRGPASDVLSAERSALLRSLG